MTENTDEEKVKGQGGIEGFIKSDFLPSDKARCILITHQGCIRYGGSPSGRFRT